MRFEVQYLVVFQPNSDPKVLLIEFLSEAYRSEIGEEDQAFIANRLSVQLTHKRIDGQFIIVFSISDDREEGEADKLCAAFNSQLKSDETVEHVLKFYDTFQLRRYQEYARQIYEVEMRLRQAISFIFIDSYGGNYYELLKDSSAKIAVKEPPSKSQLESHQENEFFFLLFDQYIRVNERKPVATVQELVSLIGRSRNIADLQNALSAKPVEHEPYTDFLSEITSWVNSIEKMRNCVAHNRSHGRDDPDNFEKARGLLHGAIDKFFGNVQKLPVEVETKSDAASSEGNSLADAPVEDITVLRKDAFLGKNPEETPDPPAESQSSAPNHE